MSELQEEYEEYLRQHKRMMLNYGERFALAGKACASDNPYFKREWVRIMNMRSGEIQNAKQFK